MPLHIVVDGYNLIRSSPELSRLDAASLEDGREALLERLAAYKRIKRLPITVVFDAGQSPTQSIRKEQFAGIKVVYSQLGLTADQVIIRLAGEKGNKLLVITSDRALTNAVEQRDAAVLDSQSFENRMEMAFYSESKGFMEDVDPADEDEGWDLTTKKKGPSKRRSKSARKKAAKLRKI